VNHAEPDQNGGEVETDPPPSQCELGLEIFSGFDWISEPGARILAGAQLLLGALIFLLCGLLAHGQTQATSSPWQVLRNRGHA
jgi:hypothetical protein